MCIIEYENYFQIERADNYMPRNDSYNTKQKDLILDTIKKQPKEFTIKDIHKELKNKTGLTTIYRMVDKMVSDGTLSKSIGINNISYYQYFEKCSHDNHFYLKCDNCKETIHIDCNCIKSLTNHITKKHNFKPSHEHIIISGLCEKCNPKELHND